MTDPSPNPPTVLVTGATDGIGFAAALALLRRGARVIVHGRSAERIARAVDELRRHDAALVLAPVRADFARLVEVRAMAAELSARDVPIGALVNNAGVFMNRAVPTDDGFETTWGVNHLAPLLLTHLLLEGRAGAALGRIVFVASDAHHHGRADPRDPGGARAPFDRLGSYAGSKLANVIVAAELARRLAARGVLVNAMHPGVISTKLLTEGFGASGPDSASDAAAAIANLVLADEMRATTGAYYDRGRPGRASPLRDDRALAARFYEASAAAVGVTPLPAA